MINILGLAVGIACTLLICLYIAHELNYDRWNPNADRIARIYGEINFGGNAATYAVTGVPVGPDVAREFPEVEAFCRFRDYGSYLVRKDGQDQQNFKEQEVLAVDSSFFKVFPVKVLAGDSRTCLVEPNTMAISKSRAEKYFGSVSDALGQILVMDNEYRDKVTAVFEDIPENSHFKAHFLRTLTGNGEIRDATPLWAVSNNFHTYLLLKKGVSYEDFRQKFIALSRKKMEQTSSKVLGMSLEEFEATGQFVRFNLQRLLDIHLYSDLTAELEANGSIQYIWIFSSIALFVLLIACINFMNLTTARSSHRAREIGIRKVLGGQRSSLIVQFLIETVLITALAVLLALVLVSVALPWFDELASRQIEIPWSTPLFWLALLGGACVVGLLAGSYPAFFLSAFDSISVLKGKSGGTARHGALRSGLVVFQFSTAVVLMIATVLVYNQLNFIRNKKLGFQKDQVIVLNDSYALGDRVEAFKQELLKNPAVQSASISSYLPVPSSRSDNTFTTSREFREDNSVNMQNWQVDYDYLKTMGMELVAGRFFDPSHPSDSSAIVLNQKAVENFGFENPVGEKIYTIFHNIQGQPTPEDFEELTVIGVVKNFHWSSLRENIGSLSMSLGNSKGLISFRYAAGASKEVIADLEQKWKEMAPTQPFSYDFLDDSFEGVYRAEQRIGQIAGIFALLAILVSCLGLFGLASFTAEQRTKEIGIRKVLGASVAGIVGLLSKDFLKLVLIALVFAFPLAGFLMNKWLQGFAYRIHIEWWVFALAGAVAVLVAFFTISFQSIRAALANPVESLRSE
ncbi:MAG: ABC transporter permease [Lewinellaceae bacterium]|nr:ABC transporter permease [Lewinellaceae bacterium]